jgi:uncharacterized iron-regulated membrane protein
MTFWDRWLRRPQSLWLRKALFQIHLWTGIGLGIYVLLISVSGSAIVFRNELYKVLWPGPKAVAISGPKLPHDALKAAIERAWPKYDVSYIWENKKPEQAIEVWIKKKDEHNAKNEGRLFDPYTGRDVGPSKPASITLLAWFSDLHTNLLGGRIGREINGLLSIFVVIMSVTGLIIWWPGMGRLRRSLTIDFRANWKRLNWDLHSVVGLWMFAFVFIWGVTGIYLVFPTPFQVAVGHFTPLQLYKPVTDSELKAPVLSAPIIAVADAVTNSAPAPVRPRRPRPRGTKGDIFLRWFYYLHFGNFGDWQVKALWVILGLVPPFLFATGAIMWWNRVLSREARALRSRSRRDVAVTSMA